MGVFHIFDTANPVIAKPLIPNHFKHQCLQLRTGDERGEFVAQLSQTAKSGKPNCLNEVPTVSGTLSFPC
ncbi:unnamed protein product [Dicrocoelium dendriticum]|nr:unnamed protein product [Dicrocoelium dendriticum]